MRSLDELRALLLRLDGRGYPAYRDAKGAWDAPGFTLFVDHVQGDPFAEPSRLRARLPPRLAGLPDDALGDATKQMATADFLNRRLAEALAERSTRVGSGRGGELRVLVPGQQVLARSSVVVAADGTVEARFRAGLPARGRRILGREAARLLTETVPSAIAAALPYAALDAGALRVHIDAVEDARALRAGLAERGLVAFIADDAILPRSSGVDDRPLAEAVPFRAPSGLRVSLRAPHAGTVTGLGVRAGVTLIVGGGFHGKSTLLRAIERGVYDHIPGDGRERVVTVTDAVKVRAEDGRAVAGADIGNFIGALPGGIDTRRFLTTNASGSTSQAAAIVEALEVGARCLLLDEDTSATNFMIRDARMQALIPRAGEPITPFIDRARQLSEQGVSTILVVGGSGDYFDVADTVIAMHEFLPVDRTADARRIAGERPTRRAREGGPWRTIGKRIPLPASIDPGRGRRAVHVRVVAVDRVAFGREEVDLRAVEQIVEAAQARALGEAVAWARGRVIDGQQELSVVLGAIMERLREDGLDAFQSEPRGDLAAFRVFELAAFLGRIRGLRMDLPD